jgi:hypothetical protein
VLKLLYTTLGTCKQSYQGIKISDHAVHGTKQALNGISYVGALWQQKACLSLDKQNVLVLSSCFVMDASDLAYYSDGHKSKGKPL